MAQDSHGSVLYKNTLGHTEFIKTVIRSIVCKFLNYCSLRHIKNGEKQVVVFAFDFIGHQINLKGFYERQELVTAFNYLSENNLINGLAADIGANIGNHSLFFRKYYPKVFSFEPNPRTYKVLNLNAELLDNITCLNFGLSDSARTAFLNINSGNVGGSHLSADETLRSNTQQEIKLETLDGVAGIFGQRLGLVKIDVEGHELAVLKGGVALLARDKPVILFEQQVENFVDGQSPVYEYLKTIGYSKFGTVKATPEFTSALPKPINNLISVILKMVFGLSYEVQVLDKLPVDSYPFIIALPEYVEINGS
jgi:FkbM family methyltransferase